MNNLDLKKQLKPKDFGILKILLCYFNPLEVLNWFGSLVFSIILGLLDNCNFSFFPLLVTWYDSIVERFSDNNRLSC